MAKAYNSFKGDEIVSIYRFLCRINEFNLTSAKSDKKIREAFPQSRGWEAAIGMENICIIRDQDVKGDPGNPADNRFRFLKGESRTILNALLYALVRAMSVGTLEKVGKKVIITARQGNQIIADGQIPFENFKSFINLFND